jgi:hypothetical protein
MVFIEQNLRKTKYPLIGFRGKRIEAVDKADINVIFGQGSTYDVDRAHNFRHCAHDLPI